MAIHRNDDGAPNTFTFLFTDLSGNRIEELPVDSCTFSLVMNGQGTMQGTLDVNDPRVQRASWVSATAPNLAKVWIDIGGTLVWGGRITRREYDREKGAVQIGASDDWSYVARRLQAADYSTNWASTPTGAITIARKVLVDALAVANSAPMSVAQVASVPSQYGITLAAPISQRMTVDSIVNQLSALGWQVGFDYANDVQYVSGAPTSTLTMSYPRRGRVAGTTGLQLDVASAITFKYGENGDSQATKVYQTSTGTGGLQAPGQWTPANTVDGYPLLERMSSHASFSSGATPLTVLSAYAASDLALSAYPICTPQITMPMFVEPVIGEWLVGDDVRVIVPKNAQGSATIAGQFDSSASFDSSAQFDQGATVTSGLPPFDPRFPNGMDFYWRITKAECAVPAEGVPTVTYTFEMPPSSTPQRPPQ